MGWLLVLAIYTQSSRAIILPHPDMEPFLSVYWGREGCRGLYHTSFRYTWDISLGLVAVTFCDLIPSTICEKLKDDILLGELVDAIFQSTESSFKLSAAPHSIFQHLAKVVEDNDLVDEKHGVGDC